LCYKRGYLQEEEFSMRTCALFFISLLVFACQQPGGEGTPGTAEQGPYLIKVNDSIITKEDVMDELDLLPVEVKDILGEQGGTEALLQELAKKEMIYLEARSRGIQDTELFQTRMEVLKKRLMVEMILEEKVEKTAEVSDKEVRDFYEENKKRFEAEAPEGGKTETMEFEVVENIIRQRLEAEKQRQAFEDYIGSLKKKYTVELNQEAIRAAFGNAAIPSE
jgi:hypothetical protein